MKYTYQDESDGTKLTIKASSSRMAITLNDGWHDVTVVLPQDERAKLIQLLEGS